jgi:hypothetical protein
VQSFQRVEAGYVPSQWMKWVYRPRLLAS